MTWYAWAVIVYIICDRLLTVASIGHSIEITRGVAILSLITGALVVWAVLALAET